MDPLQIQQTVAELGERALIERLKPFCDANSVGDDAALLTVATGHQLVVTTDVLVDTVHFSDRTTPAFSVGWRAIAANLSDLAAMGALPLGVTVGLGLPACTPFAWVEALYEGMAACLAAHGGKIVGGDVCRADQRTVAITAMGQVRATQAICRDAAQPGMAVVVTGPHGGSRAGLALLLGELAHTQGQAVLPLPSENLARPGVPGVPGDCASVREAWIQAHQRPVPRFDAIAALRNLLPAQPALGLVAGMDSSDGLANALLQLGRASGVGMAVAQSQIPLPAGLGSAVGPETALQWALYGGEDFELVLCMPQALADAFTQTPFAVQIGQATEAAAVTLVDAQGMVTQTLGDRSFQHF